MSRDVRTNEKRVALVIGNAAYQHEQFLSHPVDDARGVAKCLRALNFRGVLPHENLGFDGMRQALHSFSRTADGADIAVIYYAGHGIEVDGKNFLIPVDARLERDRDVEFQALPIDQLMNVVSGAQRLGMIIFDACRDNSFRNRMMRTIRTRSLNRGLAPVRLPTGNLLVAFSAKDGMLASDGRSEDAHSPFAKALMQSLTTPGLEIRILFGRVRDEVLKATGGAQVPHLLSSLGGDEIYLRPPQPKPTRRKPNTKPESAVAIVPRPTPEPTDGEKPPSLRPAEIFVSYNRKDRALAQHLVEDLRNEGYSVWWDKDLPAGEFFPLSTQQALDAARCAIVIWTNNSVRSPWVYEEATRANRQGLSLVPLIADGLGPERIPMPFGGIQSLPLEDRIALREALRSHDITPFRFDPLRDKPGATGTNDPPVPSVAQVPPDQEDIVGPLQVSNSRPDQPAATAPETNGALIPSTVPDGKSTDGDASALLQDGQPSHASAFVPAGPPLEPIDRPSAAENVTPHRSNTVGLAAEPPSTHSVRTEVAQTSPAPPTISASPAGEPTPVLPPPSAEIVELAESRGEQADNAPSDVAPNGTSADFKQPPTPLIIVVPRLDDAAQLDETKVAARGNDAAPPVVQGPAEVAPLVEEAHHEGIKRIKTRSIAIGRKGRLVAVAAIASTAVIAAAGVFYLKQSESDSDRRSCLSNLRSASDVLAACTRALANNPGNAQLLIARGTVQLSSANLASALVDLNQAIGIDPNNALAHDLRRQARDKTDDLDGAYQDYLSASNLDPRYRDTALVRNHYASAFLKRGITARQSGDLVRAVVDLSQAIKLDPASTEAYDARRLAYQQQGDYRRALDDYEEAVKLAPELVRQIRLDRPYAALFFERGGVRLERGEIDLADADLTRAIAIAPDFLEAYAARKRLHEKKNDFTAALQDYDELAKRSPSVSAIEPLDRRYIPALLARAANAEVAKDFKAAITAYAAVLRIEPSNRVTLVRRGDAYVATDNAALAIEDYSQALAANFNPDIAVLDKRRRAYEKIGNTPLPWTTTMRSRGAIRLRCNRFCSRRATRKGILREAATSQKAMISTGRLIDTDWPSPWPPTCWKPIISAASPSKPNAIIKAP